MSPMPDYSKPTVEEYGSVESLTEDSDKIGTTEDAVNEPGLDGSIVPDK